MGGRGAGRLRQKKFPALISGKKNSPARRAGKKNSPAWLRKCFRTPKPVFALQNLPFAVRNLLSQSKICFLSLNCFSHSVNCFTHCKVHYTLEMTFRIIKRKYFWEKEKFWKKIMVNEEHGCQHPPPPIYKFSTVCPFDCTSHDRGLIKYRADIRGGFTNLTADYQKLRLDIGVGI